MADTPIARDEARAEKLLQWLRDKWGHDRQCPYCSKDNWGVDGALVTINAADTLPRYYMVQVICLNCGHTVFINAVVAGLLARRD